MIGLVDNKNATYKMEQPPEKLNPAGSIDIARFCLLQGCPKKEQG